MARYAMDNEVFAAYAKIKSFNWSGTGWQALITNRNILIDEYPGITGVMAGTRGDQERIDLVLSYQAEDKDYILVMTNASIDKVFEQAVSIIQYASENYQMVRIVDEQEPVITVRSLDGKEIKGLSAKAVSIPVRAGIKIDAAREFYMDEISRPLKAGEQIGEVVYFVGGEELERVAVLSDTDLSRRIGYINLAVYAFALLYLIQIIYRIQKMKRKTKRR